MDNPKPAAWKAKPQDIDNASGNPPNAGLPLACWLGRVRWFMMLLMGL